MQGRIILFFSSPEPFTDAKVILGCFPIFIWYIGLEARLLKRVAVKLKQKHGEFYSMAELHDRDEFAILVTVKIKYYSFIYMKFLTIRNQIFFQDVFF